MDTEKAKGSNGSTLRLWRFHGSIRRLAARPCFREDLHASALYFPSPMGLSTFQATPQHRIHESWR